MVDVYLRSGLANRMNVLVSCMYLQKIVDEPFHYYWHQSEELNATFEDLFEPIPFVDMHPANNKFKGCGIKYVRFFLMQWYGFVKYDKVYTNKTFFSLLNKGLDTVTKELTNPKKKILLKIVCEFGDCTLNYKFFKPISKLQQQIDRISHTFNAHTLGVHIRQTDNKRAIHDSPLHLFYKKMDTCLMNQPETTFFISTDDPSVEDAFKVKYGERIYTIPNKNFSRNSVEGMQQAVVDMFLLSKTQKIIGSFHSTFNITAAKIGNIPLEVLAIDK
jgi:hypothetical protein